MSADLLFISLLSLFVLALLVPSQWRSGVPIICVLVELIIMNLAHAISQSVDVSASSEWLNISAHVEFASVIAMPICSLSIIMGQTWSSSASSARLTLKTLVELIACIGIPVIYAFLYSAVQSSGSVNVAFTPGQGTFSPSSTSVILVGVVPLIICAGCLIMSVLSAPQSLIFRSGQRSLSARAVQSLLVAGIMAIVMIVVSGLTTLSLMPSSEAEVVTVDPSTLERAAATARWWAVPANSLAVGLVLALDANTWRGYGELLQHFRRGRVVGNRRVSKLPMVSTSSKASSILPLQSGWDDSFRPLPSPKASFRRPALHVDCTITTPSTMKANNSSTVSSHSPSSSNPDSSFAESTLTYLTSPTGRRALEAFSLGSPNSADYAPAMPPPCLVIPPTPTISAPDSFSLPPPSSYTVLRKSSDGALSTISTLAGSLLAPNAWPAPPAQLPPALDVIAPFSRYQPGDVLPLPTADAPRRIEVGECPVSASPPTSPTRARIAGSLKRVGSLGSMKRMRRGPTDGVRMEVVREVREMV